MTTVGDKKHMRNLAHGVAAVLLAPSNASFPAEPAKPPTGFAQVGVIGGPQEHCRVRLENTLPQRWRVRLLCSSSREGSDSVEKKLGASAIWLLLDGGKAAIPIAPLGKNPALGEVVCTVGCTTGLTVEFEVPEDDSIAVTVRYEGTFNVFPITEEHRLQAVAY
jgi:hypothetical protein